MRKVIGSLALAASCLALACSTDDSPLAGPPPTIPPSAPVSYTRDVFPILSAQCFECHGADDSTRQGGVALNTLPLATAPVPHGQPIVPGHPETSLVIQTILSTDTSARMPPDAPPLTSDQITTLTHWIQQGAHYDSWALVRPTRPDVPAGADHPVDAFVLQELAHRGIAASPPADARTLIRRVTFDLTGVPPTLDDVEAFAADPSDDAYGALVDRLLASPRHAERLAQDWLDLAGYGDSNGIYFDEERHMWGWRDWVIDAFAHDEPFDQFVVEQLAGDLLPSASDDDRLATAFMRQYPTTEEGGVIEEQYRTQYALARSTTVGTALLGLTVQCATCHDHKYDPITQHDFYSLTACFNRVLDRGQTRLYDGFGDGHPLLSALSPLQRAELSDVQSAIVDARAALPAADVATARDAWEATLGTGAVAWTAPHIASVTSALGTVVTPQADGTIVASGPSPNVEAWEVTIDAPSTIAALRVITGPCRTDGARGTLSEVGAWIESAGARRLVSFETASEPDGTDASLIIDESNSTTYPTDGAHTITLSPREPIVLAAGEQLHVRIEERYGLFATYASLQLQVSSDPRGTLTDAMNATLAVLPSSRSSAAAAALDDAFVRLHAPSAMRTAGQQLASLLAQSQTLAVAMPVRVMADDDPTRETHVLMRGQYDAPLDLVTCGLPAVLSAASSTPPTITNRLDVARWIVSADSPTTARVIANHYFHMMYGRGIVSTLADFGAMSDAPTHPELLDWLAVQLRESGWHIDDFLRLLVTSQTYRQSSAIRDDLTSIDPDNRLLARAGRWHLDAEAIRDQALLVSGLLVEHVGGPSVRPYHPERIYEAVSDHPDALLTTYRPDRGMDALHRRGVYTFWRRSTLLPSIALLDGPDRVADVPMRDRTDTPTQALALIDEPLFVEAARTIAEHVRESATDVDAQITLAFRLCTSRMPTDAELSLLRGAYADELASATSDPSVLGVLRVGDAPRDSAGDPAAHAAMTLVVQAILSASETVTRE